MPVVERHHRDGRIPFPQGVSGDDGRDRAGDVVARPGHHFGHAGGAAGEHDHGVVVAQALRRRHVALRCGADRQGDGRGGAVGSGAHRDGPGRRCRPGGLVIAEPVDEHRPRAHRLAAGALLGARQRRIERNRNEIRPGRGEQPDDEFGVAAGAQRDPVARDQAAGRQLCGQIVDQSGQVVVADRDAFGGDDQRARLRRPPRRRLDQVGDARAGGRRDLAAGCRIGSHHRAPSPLLPSLCRRCHPAGRARGASNTDPLTTDNRRLSKRNAAPLSCGDRRRRSSDSGFDLDTRRGPGSQ
ncbi:putative beta-ketoacyl synthase [Mycobacterium intracellulare]|nr:putative beta-ketoacyl synthase [Mycobacterium intracellulare]